MGIQPNSRHTDKISSPRQADYVAIEDATRGAPVSSSHEVTPLDEAQTAIHKLVLVTFIALIFMLIEFVGGYMANSLAMLSDAVHMLVDVLGFVVSLMAIWIGRSDRFRFENHQVEVVGALASIFMIWIVTAVLVNSAVQRYQDFHRDNSKQVVDGKTMCIVACIGLVMNMTMIGVLGDDGHGHSHGTTRHDHECHQHVQHDDGQSHGSQYTQSNEEPQKRGLFASKFENLNVQAAYLHVLGDLLQSVGVTIAGAIIWWKPSWQLADPIMTFVFSVLVIGTTVGTVKESLQVLMQGH